jgi:CheY-like chemotaxis protein
LKILIVDDEPLVRRSLARAAQTRGHAILEAANGREGAELWTDARPDLVYLDVLMPELSGPDLLKKMGKTSSRVILMSAYSGGYDLQRAQSLGADLFCPKPFEDIFNIIELGEELVKNGR